MGKEFIPITIPLKISFNNTIIPEEVSKKAFSKLCNIPLIYKENVVGIINNVDYDESNAILWAEFEPEIVIHEMYKNEKGINIIDSFEVSAISMKL